MKQLILLPLLFAISVSVAFSAGGWDEGGWDDGTWDFGTPAPAQEQSSGGGDSSSGGGGGGGGGIVTNITNKKTKVWKLIRQNQVFSIDSEDGIAITKIEITNRNKELRNVELEVQSLTENPVSTEPEGNIYQFLRVNKKNIEADDIKQIKIFFKVSKEWIIDNNIEEVALMRFDGKKWHKLETKSERNMFYVITNQFSTYAVVGFSQPTKTPTKSVSGLNIQEEPYNIEIEKQHPSEETPSSTLTWIIATIVAILGVILIVVYQKKKEKK